MMISFKHEGLEEFFTSGRSDKISQNCLTKLKFVLAKLNASIKPSDMEFSGSNLHKLKGDNDKGFWSVSIGDNWRVIFRINDEKVYDVDYVDHD